MAFSSTDFATKTLDYGLEQATNEIISLLSAAEYSGVVRETENNSLKSKAP
jgi:hypothetical protein